MTTDPIRCAAEYAAKLHACQTRKYSGDPYIFHPMRVAGRMTLEAWTHTDLIVSAWLHDTIEDCGVSEAILADRFGRGAAEIVAEVTNPSRNHKSKPRRERKAMDLAHLRGVSLDAKRLKLLDRIDNVRDCRLAEADYKSLLVRESNDLLDAIGDGCRSLAEELAHELSRL